MKKILILVIQCMLFNCGIGQELLFKDGKTDWKIYIPAKATKVDIYSAEELKRALNKISKADFPIVKSDQIPAKQAIIIGSLETSPAVKAKAQVLKLKDGKSEQLAIYTLDGNLYLAGNMPRAGLFAVYRFLQKELGVRWFWAGDDGEYLPPLKEYKLPALAMNDKPAFQGRELTPCKTSRHVPSEIWFGRNLLNGGSRSKVIREKMGFVRGDVGHIVGISSAKEFKKHPEYFALIKGKRRSGWMGKSGCWSNPGFTKRVVNHAARWSKAAEFDIFNAFPADVALRCECPDCTKEKDQSSRWYKYYHELIKKTNKECPNLKFAGLAYQEYKKVPEINLDWLEYVEYCQYNRCYVHKLDDPNCSLNKISMDELKNWCKKLPMAIYGYEFDIYSPYVYAPFWNMLADQMKTYQKMGLVRMKSEISLFPLNGKPENERTTRMRLPYYIYTRLVWNPQENIDAILADWCKHLYGPAAKELLAYHKAMAKSWDNMNCHISYFFVSPSGTAKYLITPDLVALAHNNFKKAEKKINTLSDAKFRKRCMTQLNIEKALFAQWEKYQRQNQNEPSVCILTKSDSFDNVPEIELTDRRGGKSFDRTKVKMYWTDKALNFRFDCNVFDTSRIRKGKKGKDISLWYDDIIEIFFDPLDGKGYRHLAVNPAGGTYDAIGQDIAWSPKWSSKTTLKKNGFVNEISIPLNNLDITPKHGTPFRMSVGRRTRPRRCTYPHFFQDLNAKTTFYFVIPGKPGQAATSKQIKKNK